MLYDLTGHDMSSNIIKKGATYVKTNHIYWLILKVLAYKSKISHHIENNSVLVQVANIHTVKPMKSDSGIEIQTAFTAC